MLALADVCAAMEVPAVVPAAGPESVLVTVDFDDTPGAIALAEIAAAAGKEVVVRDGLVSVGDVAQTVLAVIPVGYLSPDEAREAVASLTPDGTRVRVAGRSLIVTAPAHAVSHLGPLGSVFDDAEPGQWVASCYFVRMSRSDREQLGVEIGLSASFAGLLTGQAADWLAEGLLRAGVSAESSGSSSFEVIGTQLVLLEGLIARAEAIEVVPVPRRSVSDQGTVVTVGFDDVSAGVSVEMEARGVPSGVLLRLVPEVSSFDGAIDGRPIVVRERIEVSAIIEPGGWLVVGGLDAAQDTRISRGLGRGYRERDGRESSTVVLVRLESVDADWALSAPGSGSDPQAAPSDAEASGASVHRAATRDEQIAGFGAFGPLQDSEMTDTRSAAGPSE